MLAWITFLPLAGALLLALRPAGDARLLRAVALAVTCAVAGLGIALFAGFDGAASGPQAELEASWFTFAAGREIPIRLHLGVDGASILLVALTVLLMPLVVLSSYGHVHERVKEFLAWMLVMETGMLGVFVALDLVLFYFFWEVSLVPLYFIVGIWGGERRIYATIKFFLYTFAGSLVMLVGVIALVWRLGSASVPDLVARASDELALGTQAWIFASFALAFAVKVPLLPFQTWLADAHTEAPTSGSVLLAGVLLKMGTYGLLRFGVELFPEVAVAAAPVFLALGAAGIVYGALLAIAQTDLKRLIACSSVSHLGFVALGLFALSGAALRGAVLQMVNHGLSTGLLFLLVGMIYERTHTRRLDRFGGLAAVMPVFALVFVVTVLSSAGLPGLNGFVGEYLILAGTFADFPLWAVIGTSGVVLGAVYLLVATRRVLFGPVVHEENRALHDLSARELLVIEPLLALVVWIGVQPDAFLGKTAGTLERIEARVEAVRTALRTARAEPSAPPSAAAAAPIGLPLPSPEANR